MAIGSSTCSRLALFASIKDSIAPLLELGFLLLYSTLNLVTVPCFAFTAQFRLPAKHMLKRLAILCAALFDGAFGIIYQLNVGHI